MSWIALTNLHTSTFNIRGIGVPDDAPGSRGPAAPYEIMPVGTLMCEFCFSAEPDAPQQVLHYRRKRDWLREISISVTSKGRLTMVFRQGGAVSRAAIDIPVPHRDSRLRLTYSWHAPQRAGRLTVELTDEGRMIQADVVAPVPLPVIDAVVMMRNGRATNFCPEIRYIAISDEVEPVGLGSGLGAGVPVETPHGPVPVERLRLGDTVVTAGSGPQPIRWIGKRTVPAIGRFRPIRLRAPYFGLSNDLRVAPDHRVRLSAAEAEYMLGEDEVMLEASYLAGGPGARRDGKSKLVTYYQVLLDMHECLLHDGLWSESLFVGTIARRPDVARSTVLFNMPISAIPQHRKLVQNRLSGIEARTLAAAIRA